MADEIATIHEEVLRKTKELEALKKKLLASRGAATPGGLPPIHVDDAATLAKAEAEKERAALLKTLADDKETAAGLGWVQGVLPGVGVAYYFNPSDPTNVSFSLDHVHHVEAEQARAAAAAARRDLLAHHELKFGPLYTEIEMAINPPSNSASSAQLSTQPLAVLRVVAALDAKRRAEIERLRAIRDKAVAGEKFDEAEAQEKKASAYEALGAKLAAFAAKQLKEWVPSMRPTRMSAAPRLSAVSQTSSLPQHSSGSAASEQWSNHGTSENSGGSGGASGEENQAEARMQVLKLENRRLRAELDGLKGVLPLPLPLGMDLPQQAEEKSRGESGGSGDAAQKQAEEEKNELDIQKLLSQMREAAKATDIKTGPAQFKELLDKAFSKVKNKHGGLRGKNGRIGAYMFEGQLDEAGHFSGLGKAAGRGYTYLGEFKDGHWHGVGLYFRRNGTPCYLGEWQYDRYHGEGVYWYSDGSIKHAGKWSLGNKAD